MSMKKIAWAVHVPITNTNHKMVLIALADHANDSTHDAWPSVSRLAKISALSDRSVQRSLRWLEDNCYINSQKRDRLTTIYTLPDITLTAHLGVTESHPCDDPGVTESHGGVTESQNRGDCVTPEPVNKKPVREPVREEARECARETTPTNLDVPREAKSKYTGGFERFWAAYPKKRGKAAAYNSWKTHKLESRCDDLVADVEQRKTDDTNWTDGYIPNPQTYINQERWEDELTSEVIKSNGKHKPGSIEDQLEQVRRRVELETGGAGGVEGGSDTHPSARTFEGEIFGRQTH